MSKLILTLRIILATIIMLFLFWLPLLTGILKSLTKVALKIESEYNDYFRAFNKLLNFTKKELMND